MGRGRHLDSALAGTARNEDGPYATPLDGERDIDAEPFGSAARRALPRPLILRLVVAAAGGLVCVVPRDAKKASDPPEEPHLETKRFMLLAKGGGARGVVGGFFFCYFGGFNGEWIDEGKATSVFFQLK